MKRIAILALVFATSLAAADYSGVWSGTGGVESMKYGSVPQTAKLTLLQSGTTVSGTLQLGNGPVVKISSGSVSGNRITFAAGNAFTAALTQSGAALSGKVTTSRGEIVDLVFTHK